MRIRILLPLFAFIGLRLASADLVEVQYAGSIDNVDAGFPAGVTVGTTFSGYFRYDSSAVAFLGPFAFRFATPDGFFLQIAGSQLQTQDEHNFNNVEMMPYGQLSANAAHGLAVTGPLDGLDPHAYVVYYGSTDPAFAALQLPNPFPTDFTSNRFRLAVGGLYADGHLNPVPEPSSFLLAAAAVGLVAVAALSRRRLRD